MKLLTLLPCLFIALSGMAKVTPNTLFSDHVVLQRGVNIPVWGTGTEKEKVTVSINGKTATAKTVNGQWFVKLPSMKAGGPYVLTIAGENTVTITDVMVGEVWLCSGQQNMGRRVGTLQGDKLPEGLRTGSDEANYPMIRQYHVPVKSSATPITDIEGKWEVCTPQVVTDFSAVGYQFARSLFKELKVPIGILLSAGGIEAESWTSKAALEGNPELINIVRHYEQEMGEYPAKLAQYKRDEGLLRTEYVMDSTIAREEHTALPTKSLPPTDPGKQQPAGLYNAMISPLLPYAIKGVCWYQGENNQQTPTLLTSLIADWRKDFRQKELPFLVLEAAAYRNSTPIIGFTQPAVSVKLVNTTVIVTVDDVNAVAVQPAEKYTVGERLSLAARALAYQQKIEYSGPVCTSFKVKHDEAILTFSHADSLYTRGGGLQGFTIAGNDSVFVRATANIDGNKIIVKSSAVLQPTAVRYGWEQLHQANLYNGAELPAAPFVMGVGATK